MSDVYKEYIERTSKIRFLSSPSLKDIANADDYAEKLHKNFETIGKLAKENREFLDNIFFPNILK